MRDAKVVVEFSSHCTGNLNKDFRRISKLSQEPLNVVAQLQPKTTVVIVLKKHEPPAVVVRSGAAVPSDPSHCRSERHRRRVMLVKGERDEGAS